MNSVTGRFFPSRWSIHPLAYCFQIKSAGMPSTSALKLIGTKEGGSLVDFLWSHAGCLPLHFPSVLRTIYLHLTRDVCEQGAPWGRRSQPYDSPLKRIGPSTSEVACLQLSCHRLLDIKLPEKRLGTFPSGSQERNLGPSLLAGIREPAPSLPTQREAPQLATVTPCTPQVIPARQ